MGEKGRVKFFRQTLKMGQKRQRCPECRRKVELVEKIPYRSDPSCPETEVIMFKYRCRACRKNIFETPKQGALKTGVLGMEKR